MSLGGVGRAVVRDGAGNGGDGGASGEGGHLSARDRSRLLLWVENETFLFHIKTLTLS